MVNLSKLKINMEYLRFLIKRNARLMVLISVFMFALYPLLSFTQYVLSQSYSRTTFMVGQVLLTILLVLSIFLIPFVLFSYLNSKRNLDVYHALPITRSNLYLTTIIAALIIVILPYTLVYLIGSLYYISVIPDVDGWLLVKQFWFAFALVLAILMPILFAMMNTGTNVDGFIYGSIVHLIAPLSYGAYVVYGESVLLGFRLADYSKFLLYSSPIWSLFELSFNTDRVNPNPIFMSIYWLLIGVVLTFVVLYFYQIRRSEKAESPFTNKWFFPVIATAFTIIIQIFLYSSFTAFTSNQLLDIRTLIFPIFFTFVAYMVLDVIANRGFKHFVKGFISFIIISSITLSTFAVATITGGAGYVNNVPDASKVESITLTLSDNSGSSLFGTSAYSYEKYLYNLSEKMIFDDPAHIEAIIKTHQNILDQYEELNMRKNSYLYTEFEYKYPFTSSSNGEVSLEIVYELTNGTKMARYYQLPFVWTYDLLPIIETEQVFYQKYPALTPSVFNELTPSRVTYTNPLIQDSNLVQNFNLETFARFMKTDYTNLSWQEHLIGSEVFGFVGITLCVDRPFSGNECNFQQYPILSSYTRSIAYLNSLGVDSSIRLQDDRVYTLLLPQSNLRRSTIFYISSISSGAWMNRPAETKVDVLELNHEQVLLLLPSLRMGNLNETAIGALFINPPANFLSESYISRVIYTLSEDAVSVIEQLKLEAPTRRIDFFELAYQYKD